MDAYSSYIMRMNDIRLAEMRREAAEYAMSHAARAARPSWSSRVRIGRRRPAPVEPLRSTTTLPALDAGDEPLRRTA